MSRTFHSHFADDIREMVAYKTALGHKAASYEWNLQNFDRYCMKHYPDAVTLTKEIVLDGVRQRKETGKAHTGQIPYETSGSTLPQSVKRLMFFLQKCLCHRKLTSLIFLLMKNWNIFLMLLTIIRTVATALYWNTSSLLFFDCNTYAGYAPRKCVC